MNQDEYQIEIDYSTNELTENPKYKTTNWQNSFFFTQRTRAHTISNQKCNTHNCEWDRDRMSGFGAHTDGNTRTDRYFVLQWTEIDEKKKSLYDYDCVTYALFRSLTLTYALTSVISFGSLCVRSHMLYVTEYVCVGMLLCACVHFGI